MKYTYQYHVCTIQIDSNYHEKSLGQLFEDYYISKKTQNQYLQEKRIQINHKEISSLDTLLHQNDILRIQMKQEAIDYPSSNTPCEVVYEDDFVYVAHKEPGMIIHGEEHCLANDAAAYQEQHSIDSPVRYIHRLDKETTGLVLFVKEPFFLPWYDAMLKEKKIQREYLALCHGKANRNQRFTFQDAIGKDRHRNGVYRISKTGKDAKTMVRCLARKKDILLMQCSLETGRTHQIRVHLSSHHFPIYNDQIYGIPLSSIKHMGLWAYQITFENPLSHEKHVVKDFFNKDYQMFEETIASLEK